MRAVRPLSPAELKLLSPTGGGTEWSFEYKMGRFAVQFRGDGFNHFVCHEYPAHAHWSLGGANRDEITINWAQYGTYVLRVDGAAAAGSAKGNPAEWRKMTYIRDLDAGEASEVCGHDHSH